MRISDWSSDVCSSDLGEFRWRVRNMSLLAPANALTRVLEWKDFGTPRRMSAPGPGEIKMAAQTAVGWVQNPTQLDVGPVKGSKPTVYKLVKAPTSTVQPDKSSMWVASFVFDDWSQATRDALLVHEQIHYLVVALSARDYAQAFEMGQECCGERVGLYGYNPGSAVPIQKQHR